MVAFIEFSSEFPTWSAFTFWVVAITIFLSIGFTVVVFIGGLGDLRYLIKSLDEEPGNDGDDCQVDHMAR